MRNKSRVVLPLILLVVFTSLRAAAQNYLYGTGNQTWGINLPIENGFINVANGEIHLEIPIATLPQRGSLPLNEKLVYDSRIWQIIATGTSYDFEPTNVPAAFSATNPTCTGNPPAACTSSTSGTVTFTYASAPNSMAGWRFVSGNETGILLGYFSGDAGDFEESSLWNWGWTDPSGSDHLFPFTTGTVWCPSCSPATGSGYAMDGSGYYMTVTNYTSATVFDSSGNEVYPQVIDRNGNNFTADSNGNLIDSIGRTAVKQSTSGNNIYYDVITIGGVTKRYTVTTETINLHTAFGQSGVNEYSGSLTAIQSITLPDGSSYGFTYDTGTSGNYGELESITLPTGGTISFGWANYLDSYQNQNRWLSSYSGGHGSYTFTPSVVTQCSGSAEVGCQEQMSVLDGNANEVKYLLTLNNGAWNSQMDYYQDSTQHIISTATNYNFSQSCPATTCPSSFWTGSVWATASSTTTTLEATGQVAQTQYSFLYPWSGKPSKIQRWDYYTGTPTSIPTGETDYTYGTLVNGAYFATQVNQLNSSGNVVATATLNYDQTAPTTASGATNLIAAPGGATRGNLTSVVSGVGSTITTSSTYDTAGQKITDVDGNGNSTGYSYLCSDAYPGTISYPVVVNGSHLQTQTGYDCSSGLVTSTEDPNGVVSGHATTYTYFPSGANIGRIETINYPDGGSKAYAYPSSTETDQTVAQSASVNAVSKQILDSFGRSYQSALTAPEGSITSETTYDLIGMPSCVTNAHLSGTTSPTDGTTCTFHDVLGRPWFTSLPDGNSTSITYNGSTRTVTDELGHSKEYTYDAFNRLISVLEPNTSGTLTYETDYQYNALNNLIQVDQWGAAKGSASPGDRQRLFAYDSFGREIAENIPENQSATGTASLTCAGTVSGTKWTSCFSYDGNSNITASEDNRQYTTTSSYDALNRPLSVTFSDGSGPILYGYDFSNSTFSNATSTQKETIANPLGNLSWACKENSAQTFCVGFDVFSYDAMSRIVQQWASTPTYPASSTIYGVSAGYDLAGNLINLTYPDGRVVSQSFDSAGRSIGTKYSQWGSTSVGTSYFSNSTFAPPGQSTSSTMGSGLTVTSSFNPRQSIASLAYTNTSGDVWSKQFRWDKNAANLLLLSDGVTGYGRKYSYDTLNRLTSAQDVLVSSGNATGTVTFAGGPDKSAEVDCVGGERSNCTEVWNSGNLDVLVNGSVVGSAGFGNGSTAAGLASAAASSINSNVDSPVTATSSGAVVTLTSIIGGAAADYSLSTSSTYNATYFTSPSFSATASGSTLTGGAGSPPPGGLNETYTYDPFGNLTQSGNFSFSQSFNSLNQINGYSYDASGNQNTDIGGQALVFDASGMLTSVGGTAESYTYDAAGNRVEVAGSAVTDYIYFGGAPIATFSGGAYTDLIYAGGSLIAEVGGTQSAVPAYRITDNLSSLGGSYSNTGPLSGAVNYAPYGQLFSGSTTDRFGFTGLQWDATTATNHAGFRQFSPQQGRWQSPDPYAGSYDWANPQTLNRYAYVSGTPMALTDPSGLDGGGGGSPVGIALNIFYDFYLLLDLSDFHGSLKPRPSANPWSDKFGVPYGGLGNGIGQALGLPSGGCEFGSCGSSFTNHNESQTRSQLQQAYLEATAGRIRGLENIWNNSNHGRYDFGENGQSDDTWTLCGMTMKGHQFANFLAGFEGASYDRNYFWTTGAIWAQLAVNIGGVGYHFQGATQAQNDPLDFTGRPDIHLGQTVGWHWQGPDTSCTRSR